MPTLKVFISHHHEEKLLAKAWQTLIHTLTQHEVTPWYSSDERAEGGVGPGEWRPAIRNEIEKADVILVLVTPASNERPWLFFESGIASGLGKEIIPVYYFMKEDGLNDVFRSLTCYAGDSSEGASGVEPLCAKLIYKHLGSDAPAGTDVAWKEGIAKYLELVTEERGQSFTRRLFQDHSHDHHAASQLEGEWFAKWTEQDDRHPEAVFEEDRLRVWTTLERIRMVIFSATAGTEKLSPEARKAANHYPMEGIVSRSGLVALSYWSAGRGRICGTALLAPVGATGELLEGTWQGFTAKDINETPRLTQGRVVMSRNDEVVKTYWPEVN
jgi:TIR domain